MLRMIMMHLNYFKAAILCFALAISGAAYADNIQIITHVIDGDTLITDKGENIRLLGINTPEIKHGKKPAQPLAYEAKAALAQLEGQKINVVVGQRKNDKYGRLLAHLYTQNSAGDYDQWVNGMLVRQGFAHVYSFPDNRELTKDLQTLEQKARQEKIGLWSLPRWQIREATQPFAAEDIGRFHLVQGKVTATAFVNGITYLNFGKDWRTDFSVEIRPEDLKTFKKSGIDPVNYYKGQTVLVRGQLKPVNGVLVTVTHPEQLTIIK